MVPWQSVDTVLDELLPLLAPGDTVIDGGNSPYTETIARASRITGLGLRFLDVGVSGGPSGARNGACMMVGGTRDDFTQYETLFKDCSIPGGYGYMGEHGAGHFVKMVHNGIEYGMMQAIGEGFEVLKRAPEFSIDLTEVARVYNTGSVIESRLVGWLHKAYQAYGPDLDTISGKVSHSGEGLWTVEAAKRSGIPVPIIEGSLAFREASQNNSSYTGQVVSVLRNQFGGHHVTDTSNT
jgi:6-phosphogluconate dehydrogenase